MVIMDKVVKKEELLVYSRSRSHMCVLLTFYQRSNHDDSI